jgi:hypothetical protein
VTLLGKCVTAAIVAAVLLGGAMVYGRSASGAMWAETSIAIVVAIAALLGLMALTVRRAARAHAEDNATTEASNAALRSVAATTGLSHRQICRWGESSVQPDTLTGTYRGVALRVTGNRDYGVEGGGGSYTVVVVPAFPASASPAMRAAMGRKVRLRAKVVPSAPPALPGGLPPDLALRLKSKARAIIVDDHGLEYQMKPQDAPFWRVEGDLYHLETDPVRLVGVIEDVCELARLAGTAGEQDGRRCEGGAHPAGPNATGRLV